VGLRVSCHFWVRFVMVTFPRYSSEGYYSMAVPLNTDKIGGKKDQQNR